MNKNYWRLWTATLISNLGDGVASVAYPWLASAVTRSPILIALIAVASRGPWLVFTLFAGVISDRFNKKKILVAMDSLRGLFTVGVAVAITLAASSLPNLNDLTGNTVTETQWPLYIVLLVASLLFGMAEVLRDNTAQTFMPLIVEKEQLEKANGRLWTAESATNSFIGPPLGSFLIAIAIYLPFWFDATSFFVAAALIASLKGSFHSAEVAKKEKINFKKDISEGFAWLWSHSFFRRLAIILGLMNFTGSLVGATFILFAQEVLHTSVKVFAILGTAGAIGNILGSSLGARVSAKFGSGTSLRLALISAPIFNVIIAFTTSWQVLWVLTIFEAFLAVLWNLITVSLRQSTIPQEIFGRVNSVYRFFAWGSIPLGILGGGAIVSIMQTVISRQSALRATYLIAASVGALLFIFAARHLTTERIEEVKRGN